MPFGSEYDRQVKTHPGEKIVVVVHVDKPKPTTAPPKPPQK